MVAEIVINSLHIWLVMRLAFRLSEVQPLVSGNV